MLSLTLLVDWTPRDVNGDYPNGRSRGGLAEVGHIELLVSGADTMPRSSQRGPLELGLPPPCVWTVTLSGKLKVSRSRRMKGVETHKSPSGRELLTIPSSNELEGKHSEKEEGRPRSGSCPHSRSSLLCSNPADCALHSGPSGPCRTQASRSAPIGAEAVRCSTTRASTRAPPKYLAKTNDPFADRNGQS